MESYFSGGQAEEQYFDHAFQVEGRREEQFDLIIEYEA